MNKKSVIGARCYQLQLIYMHKRQMTKVGTTAEEMQALKMDKMPFNGATYDHCGDEATGDQAYLDGFIDGLYVDRRQH